MDPMTRAVELAAYGLSRTAPNPPVGAVVVRDGVIVGEGYHRAAGEPHAEAVALATVGEAARGATLFSTLEPCCHQGRTPACTDTILAAGITRSRSRSRTPILVCTARVARHFAQQALRRRSRATRPRRSSCAAT